MGLGHFGQRRLCAHQRATEIRAEILDRHKSAVVGACLVIDRELAARLAQHKQQLPGCHIRQRRPVHGLDGVDLLHIRQHAHGFEAVADRDCLFRVACPFPSGTADCFEQVAGHSFDAEQACIGCCQMRATLHPLFKQFAFGRGCLVRVDGDYPALIAVGDVQCEGGSWRSYLGQIAFPSAKRPRSSAISTFRRTASYLSSTSCCC